MLMHTERKKFLLEDARNGFYNDVTIAFYTLKCFY